MIEVDVPRLGLVQARGRAPYRFERAGVALLVLDDNGMNTITFPSKPGAVFFPDEESAECAAEMLNEKDDGTVPGLLG